MSLLTYVIIGLEEGAKRRVGQCLRVSDDIIQDFNLYKTPSQCIFFSCQIRSDHIPSLVKPWTSLSVALMGDGIRVCSLYDSDSSNRRAFSTTWKLRVKASSRIQQAGLCVCRAAWVAQRIKYYGERIKGAMGGRRLFMGKVNAVRALC
jgi:hypothetical protein